jgi:hypothetical protein
VSADRAGLRRLMAEVAAARDAAIATGSGDLGNAEWVAFFAADDSLALAAKVTLPGLLDLLDRCETALADAAENGLEPMLRFAAVRNARAVLAELRGEPS